MSVGALDDDITVEDILELEFAEAVQVALQG
jgi:hypothetical protein